MNNYSTLERILHKIALSSQFMREVTFDFESAFLYSDNNPKDNIFIAGLARSGTTILLNSLYKSNIFASLTYRDMPFILAPNLWSKLSSKEIGSNFKERSHGDGIKFGIDSPEAFEEIFWKTFAEDEVDTIPKFQIFINNILNKYHKNRYLSKNNQNIKRIQLIADFFECSEILIPFRDPIQQSYSLLTQHKRFIDFAKKDRFIAKYMNWIGHTEFGPNYIPIHTGNIFKDDLDINHWLEQWYLTYKNCVETLINKKNVHFVSYERLCSSKDYWIKILNMVKIKNFYKYEFIESRRKIYLDLDSKIINDSLTLYDELNKL